MRLDPVDLAAAIDAAFHIDVDLGRPNTQHGDVLRVRAAQNAFRRTFGRVLDNLDDLVRPSTHQEAEH